MALIEQEAAEKEALIKKVKSMTPEQFCRFIMTVCGAYMRQDAAQVAHGKWINREGPDEDMNVTDQCSRCGHRDTHSPTVDVPYCWFCGARMDGGEVHEDN